MEFIKPSPSKRLCAFLIDYLLFELLGILTVVLFLANVGWMFWVFGTVFRDCWDGQSLGKRIVGLKVLDAQGNAASPMETIKRNITLVLPLVPLVELFLVFRDQENGQRLGDRWAQTMVTDLKSDENESKYIGGILGLIFLMIIIQFVFITFMQNVHPGFLEKHMRIKSVETTSSTNTVQ